MCCFSSGHTPQKTWKKKLPEITRSQTKFEMLNINGVLYKTSNTKLRRHPIQSATQSTSTSKLHQVASSPNRSLTIRGSKFYVDQSGSRLRRVSMNSTSTTLSNMHRIDVGGMTYLEVAPNTFQRTDSHRTRIHLNHAIQKSINLLAKNRTKNNVPCAIFRRLGKCIALERGRCTKVHDPQRVTICPKLRTNLISQYLFINI